MYPVPFEADYQAEQNRATTFFRIILAIPWLIVAYVYEIAAFFTQVFAWFALVITGKYPEGLYKLNAGFVRYRVRVFAWVYLQTDEWPPFGIADDPGYPIRVDVAPREEQQSRLKVFFRIILALPMLVVVYAVAYMHSSSRVIAWLTIVFRGYLPEGVNNAMTFCNSFYARVYGYLALLTDDYPPVGDEKARAAAPGGGPPCRRRRRPPHRRSDSNQGKGGQDDERRDDDKVERGEGWSCANLADLGEGPGLPQDPRRAGGDRLRRQRDRPAPLLRHRQPLPRGAGGALLRPLRAGWRSSSATAPCRSSSPAASPGSTPPPTAASATSATPRRRSTWSSAARTATSAATGSSPRARRTGKGPRSSGRAGPVAVGTHHVLR